VPSSLRFQFGHPVRQTVHQIQQGHDQGLEAGVLGSWVLVQHLGGEGAELIGHRLRVLHQPARSVVDLRALRANFCQKRDSGT